jgi:hypothetical protein
MILAGFWPRIGRRTYIFSLVVLEEVCHCEGWIWFSVKRAYRGRQGGQQVWNCETAGCISIITGIKSSEFEIEAPARPWIMSDVFLVSPFSSFRERSSMKLM